MTSDLPIITVRIEDEIKRKLRIIARQNGRYLSNEAAQVLKRYVESYERKHGEIKLD